MAERGTPFKPDMVRAVLRDVDPKRITRRFRRLGNVGDVLWVREAWRTLDHFNHLPPRELNSTHAGMIRYEADEDAPIFGFGKLRPGMFMCRWMSRIDLQLVDVREERLQDITEEDAKAEGAECCITTNMSAADRLLLPMPMYSPDPYRNGFALLWNAINGDGSWESNPTVFRHVFERIK